MDLSPVIPIGEDGFYHPSNEDEIIALVQKASAENLGIRARGAAHSLSRAIYTDPGKGMPELPNIVSEQNPPQGPNLNIMFDQYSKLYWIDEKEGIIEAEAGIHLGYDPDDPTGVSTLENSLLYQALKKGFTLSDLGGITHQTVGGFLMTGSSGGTIWYSIEENIEGLSMIDANGKLEWFNKGDEYFEAIVLSLGLLGLVCRVRMKLTPIFNIYGQQITYPVELAKSPIDYFGDGTADKPGLEDFLRKTPYSRLLWWPQDGVKRMVIWQAVRGYALPVFDPAPYEEFADDSFFTNLEQLGASMLFTMLGNSKSLVVWQKLKTTFSAFNNATNKLWGNGFWGWLGAGIITFILQIFGFLLVLFLMTFRGLLEKLYPVILDILQPLTKKGEGLLFMDYTYRSLPMDNNASDIMLDTEFTEIWIPLSETKHAMQVLDRLFTQGKFKSTGYYSTEFYTGKKSTYWMSPAYDRDVFRIDVFWFKNNEGDPGGEHGFYSQFWEELKKENIPMRFHWAKFIPEYNYEDWARYIKDQYPRWDDFMALREKRDPKNIFLTNYWSLHLFGKPKG